MNVQPKPSPFDDCTMPRHGAHAAASLPDRRLPRGPRSPASGWASTESWPLELEVEPWRP
jgi:hypothetical protein